MYSIRKVYLTAANVEYYVLNTCTLTVQSVWTDYIEAMNTVRLLNRS